MSIWRYPTSHHPRSRCRNAVHFSMALGISCACGASWLVESLLAPICIKEQHSSKTLIPNCLQPGAIASAEDSSLQANQLERCLFGGAGSFATQPPRYGCLLQPARAEPPGCTKSLRQNSVGGVMRNLNGSSPFTCPLCSASGLQFNCELGFFSRQRGQDQVHDY